MEHDPAPVIFMKGYDMAPDPQFFEKERVERLEREAAEHNAGLIPEREGYVRMDGPRRQSRAEVINGVLHYIEI